MFKDAEVEDLNQMFRDTLVLYNKWPVKIVEVDHNREALTVSLATGASKNISIDDKRFDFTPFELGNVNGDGCCAYMVRKGLRRWKQGLNRENINVFMVETSIKSSEFSRQLRKLDSRFLINTIKGLYPSKEEALELVSSGSECAAFSRLFSVDNEFNLIYKYKTVGMVDADNGKLVFKPSKAYMKTLLEN